MTDGVARLALHVGHASPAGWICSFCRATRWSAKEDRRHQHSRQTHEVVLDAAEGAGRAAAEAADVELGRIGKALLVGDFGAQALEVALNVARRLGRIAVRIETKALGEPGAVGALDRVAQTLDRGEDLRRKVVLVICQQRGGGRGQELGIGGREPTDVPILSSGSFLISSTV